MGSTDIELSDLAREIGMQCVAGRVRKLSRVITSLYDDALRGHDVSANQLTILGVVAMLEEATPADIEKYLLMERSTISRNVGRMVDAGLLAKMPGGDARSVSIILAPRGRRLLREAIPSWRRAQREARELLGDEGFAAIARAADTLPVESR